MRPCNDGPVRKVEEAHGKLKKQSTKSDKRHVVWLDPNDPEGAYAAMMALLDEAKTEKDAIILVL
jgi:3-oxoacyl-(acyl-carrier-protein) synthase